MGTESRHPFAEVSGGLVPALATMHDHPDSPGLRVRSKLNMILLYCNQVDWKHVFALIIVPTIGFIITRHVPLRWETLTWSVIYYFMTGIGITAGYHRLWAHSSYSATLPLRIYLAAMGAGAGEQSIRWWSRDHRAHHRYTDTKKDPYSVRKGLLYSHMGWLLMSQDPKNIGRVNISDLNEDPVVVWQHKHIAIIGITMCFIFPCLVSGIGWGDWQGGLLYAGLLRMFFVQQATFCVNSLAHWLGEQPFDDTKSPRDHLLTALATLGEGYHNFHHEFPSDYRNAIRWFQYDPTKWSIWIWKQLGLAYDLRRFRQNEIEMGQVQQEQKRLDSASSRLRLYNPLTQLPIMEWGQFQEQALKGRTLVVIAGVVHDIEPFMRSHPGGLVMINSGIGKDATAMFNGGVYSHSRRAHTLLSNLAIAILRGGCEVEIWKQNGMSSDENSTI